MHAEIAVRHGIFLYLNNSMSLNIASISVRSSTTFASANSAEYIEARSSLGNVFKLSSVFFISFSSLSRTFFMQSTGFDIELLTFDHIDFIVSLNPSSNYDDSHNASMIKSISESVKIFMPLAYSFF